MRKIILTLLILPLFFVIFPSSIQAAAKTKTPSLSASIAKNKRSASVIFSNLTNVKSIKYQLSYSSNKGNQGAGGTIKVAKNTKSLSRTLLFGTCSHGVCTYNSNLKNVKLTVDFILLTRGIISYDKKL